MIKHAFLFMVVEGKKQTFKVAIARCTDFMAANVAWMDNPEFPVGDTMTNGTWQLSIDITESVHSFNTFEEAEQFYVNHYKAQS